MAPGVYSKPISPWFIFSLYFSLFPFSPSQLNCDNNYF